MNGISQRVNVLLLMTKEFIDWRELEFTLCVFIDRYALLIEVLAVEECLCVYVGVRVCM